MRITGHCFKCSFCSYVYGVIKASWFGSIKRGRGEKVAYAVTRTYKAKYREEPEYGGSDSGIMFEIYLFYRLINKPMLIIGLTVQ